MQQLEQVIIGVDPHKLSATIEVVDGHERMLGSGRFATDRAGYSAMRRYAKAWPGRVWAVGSEWGRPAVGAAAPGVRRAGRGRAGEASGQGPAVRHRPQPQDRRPRRPLDCDGRGPQPRRRGLRVDGQLEALRMLVDRREALTRRRIQTVDRLQALLAELLPGQAKKDISTGQAKRMLATVRPRDVAGWRRGPWCRAPTASRSVRHRAQTAVMSPSFQVRSKYGSSGP